MRRYFIELAYNGTQYSGWQNQPNAITVQQVIEASLSKLLKTPMSVVGCGRTDAGVHSSQYFAHMDCEIPFEPNADFIFHLNCVLPKDIAVYRVYESDLHARFDAKQRQYKYHIQRIKNPFLDHLVWPMTNDLDTQAMSLAAAKLLDYRDFASFARTGSDNKTTICTIFDAHWDFTDERYTFTISADRFLRGMVRAIVGTLVDVGRGKVSVEQFTDIIGAKNRALASSSAPADGLYLTKIDY